MNDELQELASAYVLGTLSAAQRTEVERRLPTDRELREAVEDWERRLLPLNNLVEPVQPSPQLWPRIEETLRFGLASSRDAVQDVVSWWNNLKLWRGLATGGLATAAALAMVLVLQTPPKPQYMVVLVAPEDKSPGWVVQADGASRVRLIPLGTFNVPQDRSLQFWTKAEGWSGPVSLGLVKPGQALEVALDKLPPLEANQLFEITLEPYAGSPLDRPTGPVLHIGRAVKVM